MNPAENNPQKRPNSGPLSRLVRNAGVLFTGNSAADLCTVGALALAARLLGPETFGVFALIQTYVLVVSQVVNFQSWQGLVRYGAARLAQGDRAGYLDLVRCCAALDLGVGVVGTLAAVLGLPLLASWYGWDPGTVRWAQVGCLGVLCSVTDTAVGVLQLQDRFGLLAVQNSTVAAGKLLLVGLAAWLGGGLAAIILAWLAAGFLGVLVLVVAARRDLGPGFSAWSVAALLFRPRRLAAQLRSFPGLFGFLATTNLHGSVRLASREVDLLLVGGLLGPAAAGILKIAKQVGSLFSRLAAPLYTAVYPELARLYHQGERQALGRLLRRATLTVGCASLAAWVLFALVGRWPLVAVLGPAYGPAHPVAVVYTLAMVVALVTFSFHPLLLAMGRPGLSLAVLSVATGAYFALLGPMVARFGTMGVAWAYLGFYGLWAALMAAVLCHLWRCEAETPVPPPVGQPVGGGGR